MCDAKDCTNSKHLSKCSKCLDAIYSSVECQQSCWLLHKVECKVLVALRNVTDKENSTVARSKILDKDILRKRSNFAVLSFLLLSEGFCGGLQDLMILSIY